jgi:mono/diheme cytochrome c family protein
MDKAIFYTHLVSVILFMVIYLVKTILLLANSTERLRSVTKAVKVPEMIVSFLFLATGVYMLTKLPSINTLMWIKIACVLASIPLAVVGFKKGNKALAVLAMLLIIGSYGLAEMSHKKLATGGSGELTTTSTGKEIYIANCKQCHGEDGTAGVMNSANLKESTMDKNTLFGTIKSGKGTMVGYDGVLSDEQINAVVEYVETLRK